MHLFLLLSDCQARSGPANCSHMDELDWLNHIACKAHSLAGNYTIVWTKEQELLSKAIAHLPIGLLLH